MLILDEPTVGLDPKQIIEIRNLIKNLGRNHTIILSSHILSEVQAVCERVIIINSGKLVADGATDRLAHDLSTDHRIIARIAGPEHDVLHAIRAMDKVVEVVSMGEKEPGVYEYHIEAEMDQDIRRDLFALLTRKGWPLMSSRNTDLTLEEIFLRLTSGENHFTEQERRVLLGDKANETDEADETTEEIRQAAMDAVEQEGGEEE